MLEKFDGGRSKRVYDIITGDESWFYYYDPETKRQSQVWDASNDPHPTKVCRQRSVGKHMFAIFFMKSGFNTIIPLENGKTVTAKWYTNECLSNVLKQVEKHRCLNDLIIHHDNASAHKAAQTMEYLEAQRVKLMGHPAYSADLIPCDFWLFPKIKEQLRGKNFQDINEIHAAVQEQMDGLRKEDFYQCYEQWFERMNKCISAQGHYFEQI
jgi:histone-lysine N-methyltransferase SETMAR